MTDSDDKFKLSDEDIAHWEAYIADIKNDVEENSLEQESFVEMLDGNAVETSDAVSTKASNIKDAQAEEKSVEQHLGNLGANKEQKQADQIDKRTAEKLRKGKMPIEERIDLHGLSKSQAHEKLQRFLMYCHSKNLRCVLVITGKGAAKKTSDNWLSPSKGVLKENVPYWLNENPLKYIVLKFCSAQACDGGTGALYVYLKKKK